MKEILFIVWCALIEALKIVATITIGVTCVFFFIYGILALIEFIIERISHNTR